MKLTIGMTVYDDFDGAWQTLTALDARYVGSIPYCEFVIVDNNPGSEDGKALRKFVTRGMREWECHDARYIPHGVDVGVAPARNRVFREARGDFVLCLDSHVVLDGLPNLLHFLERNPNTSDLLTGPVVMDDSRTIYSYLRPQWHVSGFGVWSYDDRADRTTDPPFEIPSQGLGVFCCRKDVWPGFDFRLRGYGCVEAVLCEKFRRMKARVICLPFMRWRHRWTFYKGPPYTVSEYDRLRNHLISFLSVGWDVQPVLDHFCPRLTQRDVLRIAGELGIKLERKEDRGRAIRWLVKPADKEKE